jgi:hypothetical protein
MFKRLNVKQRVIYDRVVESIRKSGIVERSGCFFHVSYLEFGMNPDMAFSQEIFNDLLMFKRQKPHRQTVNKRNRKFSRSKVESSSADWEGISLFHLNFKCMCFKSSSEAITSCKLSKCELQELMDVPIPNQKSFMKLGSFR